MILRVENIESGYGKKQVLYGVSLHLQPGEVVALVGPNGAGKSTALKTIFGLVKATGGKVVFEGKDITNRHPAVNVRDGLCYVPQGGRVFDSLCVRENLEVGAYTLNNKRLLSERLEVVWTLFPELKERERQPAGKLSGGEKQMLAVGRALMLQPKLLLLDEPSLGLAPPRAKDLLHRIQSLNREFGTTVLLVEQNVPEVLPLAQRVYVLRLGKVVLEASSHQLSLPALREAFLG